MKPLNTSIRYGWLSITLHWLTLAVIVGVYGCILLSDSFPRGSNARTELKTLHYMLGLSVFWLVWLRLIVRWSGPAPMIVPPLSTWQTNASHGLHIGLYGLMVVMPLVGWLILSAAGKSIPFFGLQLPPLISPNEQWVDPLKEVHEAGATVGYFLIGLHAAAALCHHYLLQDNTLTRMLPDRKSGS